MGFLSFNRQKIVLYHSYDAFEIKALQEKMSASNVRLINLAKEPVLPVIWQEIEAALKNKVYVKELDLVAVNKSEVSLLNGLQAVEDFLVKDTPKINATKIIQPNYSKTA